MPTQKRVSGVLTDEDFELFKIAIKRYGLGESKLTREIIHSWLFANRLQLQK